MAAAIRVGALCKSCSAKQCNDLGTEAEPIDLECPLCNGSGCDECYGLGNFRVVGCPNDYCRSIAKVARFADLFEKGLPPVAGGALDQAVWFLDAVQVLSNDETEIRRQR